MKIYLDSNSTIWIPCLPESRLECEQIALIPPQLSGKCTTRRSNTAKESKRKRLDGGGRQVNNPELDVELAEWIREKQEHKQPVSRRIISIKAGEVFRGTDMKVSIGWLNSFLKRHNFTRRRVTTTAQKPPKNYAEAVAQFVVHVEERRKAVKFSSVLAMDETAVWFNCPDNTCIDTKGPKI
uniref:HTH CENPB-type domain-containing protein n=1 Tax=Ditylenchus dipsaci TaxID=166011 RepID=A0A915EFB1_9BILA